jgi:hypothetical protein
MNKLTFVCSEHGEQRLSWFSPSGIRLQCGCWWRDVGPQGTGILKYVKNIKGERGYELHALQ